jgi:ABC-type uncharacterized transport system ATPase subunit
MIEFRQVTKRFGACIANQEASFSVSPATLHGIVGENGAGKSTAMKMLYGMYRPDSGEILLGGVPRVWGSPRDAIANGIGMVHQHFMLAGRHSALDNIILGAEPSTGGFINRMKALAELEALAQKYGLAVPFELPVEQLPVGVQQRIEILKLLYRRAEILILDEPTAVLTPVETNSLFANLKKLREEGKTILLVTHKLKEVMAFADRVTVFRQGKVTGELDVAKTNPQELADLMVGRKVALNIEVPPGQPLDEPAIEVTDLNLARGDGKALAAINFSVRKGEIVGIAGVEGNGQSELLQALVHPAEANCRTSGQIRLLGNDVSHWAAGKIRELSLAVIPEDRLAEGLLPEQSLSENFLLGQQNRSEFSARGWLKFESLSKSADAAVTEYDVRPPTLQNEAGRLSGGNQQKLIFARELHRKPEVIIAAQPTRGVDVGAVEFIHRRIIAARDAGAGVLLISSELDEILALSDRILVMFGGRIVAEFSRGKVTERELGLKMGGA